MFGSGIKTFHKNSSFKFMIFPAHSIVISSQLQNQRVLKSSLTK